MGSFPPPVCGVKGSLCYSFLGKVFLSLPGVVMPDQLVDANLMRRIAAQLPVAEGFGLVPPGSSVSMSPSRGYTLGESILGGARLGARGGGVMGATVRGAGALGGAGAALPLPPPSVPPVPGWTDGGFRALDYGTPRLYSSSAPWYGEGPLQFPAHGQVPDTPVPPPTGSVRPVPRSPGMVSEIAGATNLGDVLGDPSLETILPGDPIPTRPIPLEAPPIPRPSRLARIGSALKTGAKAALAPANVVKGALIDATAGTVVGGTSAGLGTFAGRPSSAGTIVLPPGSTLFDEAGSDGDVDQATFLRAIESADRDKEALRQNYIDEINAQHGEGTIAPGARIEEISNYLGPVRWPYGARR